MTYRCLGNIRVDRSEVETSTKINLYKHKYYLIAYLILNNLKSNPNITRHSKPQKFMLYIAFYYYALYFIIDLKKCTMHIKLNNFLFCNIISCSNYL